jgi:nicotinamide-nucleotide amidase
MYAEIITIGDEILIGQIVDSNSAWIAQQLNEIGIEIKQISSVSDKLEEIKEALSLASRRADVILVTGGLGPTNDDLTREALASYFHSKTHLDPKTLAHIEKLFANRGKSLLDVNIKQAEVLDIAEVLFNEAGTAPGMYIKSKGKHFFIMPGVPFEMRYLMENEVIPRLQEFPSRDVLIHKSILTAGIGESSLALQIAPIEKSLPSYMHLAYLPSFSEVRLRINAKGKNKTELIEKVNHFIELIKNEVPDNWFAEDDGTLEEALLNYLIQHKLRLSTAESCTGGRIANLLTSIAGSSNAYDGGVVAYSNALKVALLDVQQSILDKFGAVSEPTVIAMAEGAKKKFQTDYAIATSGIAGPGGGTVDKPIGTVWIAIAGKTKTVTKQFHFDAMRIKTIERASKSALILLFKLLYEEIGRDTEEIYCIYIKY